MGTDALEVVDEFFAAVERGDGEALARLYADDVEVWHNITGQVMDKAANLRLLRFWARAVGGLRYEVLERQPFPGGVVQRHVVHGTVDGSPLRAEVCIVIHVDDGRITKIFEYLDRAAVAAVFDRPPASSPTTHP